MLQQSEKIGDLMVALAKAQAVFENPTKDSTANIKSEKGSYSFKYATLDTALAIVRPVLSDNGIALLQRPYHDAQTGYLMVETRLAHGEQWISTLYPASNLSTAKDIKQIGGAITYARRYCLYAILGIAGEEDHDGDSVRVDVGGRPVPARSGNGNPPKPPAPPSEPQRSLRATQPLRPAAVPSAPPKPSPGDPEAMLKWIDLTLGAITEADPPHALETVWNDQIEPRLTDMFPPDREEAVGLFRKHERRLER